MERRLFIAIAVAQLLVLFTAPDLVAGNNSIRVSNTHFIDANEGIVTFRGLNAAGNSKGPDFMPITHPELLDPLVDWGVNVIRLLFIWEAYETEKGTYSEEYSAHYRNIINWAWERHIHVIIDFHQDAFSRYQVNGCGDGFPRWAIPEGVRLDTPNNLGKRCKLWGAEMIWDIDMHTCWNRFYNDTYGVRTKYLEMLDRVSREFGNHPAVLGYDLLNEPWGDEIDEIAPLYEDAAVVVRNNDPDSILFLCPHALISAGSSSELPKMSFGNYAYAPHYYDDMIIVMNVWWGIPPDGKLDKQKAKSDSWDVPIFWGEFGADATAHGGRDYLDLFYAWLNKNHASGTQWNYTPGWTPEHLDGHNRENLSIVDDLGQLRDNYRIRPYAQRIAGTPGAFEVKRNANDAIRVTLEWEHEASKGDTVIFLPRQALFGSSGYTIERSDSLTCAYDAAMLYLHCTSPEAGKKSITITAADF
jgi:endoglycosylceramidase